MNTSDVAQQAFNFLNQFKVEIMKQVNQLNSIADGELQDGYNTTFLDDGWVTLKGCSWGFVLHYDDPVRIDMTFGPDQPFVGHRMTFVSSVSDNGFNWVNPEWSSDILNSPTQLARFGLQRLAAKVGDGWLFESEAMFVPLAAMSEESYQSSMVAPAPSYVQESA